MIVRQTKEIPTNYVYGIGGGVACLFVAIFMFRGMLVPTVTPSCEQRYMNGVRFSFARQSGDPLTAAELQGKLAGLDWGLNENVHMRKIEQGPAPVVLEIDLKTPHIAGSEAIDTGRSGMGFVWQPRSLQTASAGCLSYNVWVPQDFSYGRGGVLPGLSGEEKVVAATDNSEERQSKPFATRIRWNADGTLAVVPITQDWNKGKVVPLADLKLERGRWTRIDQEVILNTAGEADGGLRVWVNGVLGIEVGDMIYRGDAQQKMNAVNVDIHFADDELKWTPALKNTKLRMSPIELRMQ